MFHVAYRYIFLRIDESN
uniref:Uncharacterized protein n=1 Tax=Arundo donax TaxID=35708 RepID=A0A0A9AHE8_ARUDO